MNASCEKSDRVPRHARDKRVKTSTKWWLPAGDGPQVTTPRSISDMRFNVVYRDIISRTTIAAQSVSALIVDFRIWANRGLLVGALVFMASHSVL